MISTTHISTVSLPDLARGCVSLTRGIVARSVALIIPAVGTGLRNGYKQVAQLALSSPVLLDTLVSVSTTYMHLRGIVPQSSALRRQSQALASLRRSISTLSNAGDIVPPDTACLQRDLLATILLQVTVEMANGTSVIQTHLPYAISLFKSLGYDKYRPTSSVGIVLVQRMCYIDVLSSVFWRRRPLLPLDFWLLQEEEYQVDETTPSFQETTGCSLWTMSILANVSHLVADMEDGVGDDFILPQAMRLESKLTESAKRYFDSEMDPQSNQEDSSRHLGVVCESYYWSAVILLQRRLCNDSRDSRRVQFCLGNLIRLLESLPLGCGPDTQISLPLYVAAQVAIKQEHRDRLRAKSTDLSGIYPLKTRTALVAAFEVMWAACDSQAIDNLAGNARDSDPMKDNGLFIC